MASSEVHGDVATQIFERLARLEERMLAIERRVDDVGVELRAMRLRVDTMLLATVGLIATVAIKL